MEIALLGGTGDLGEGLALRLARDTDHSIAIGSRDTDKAEKAATAYREQLQAYGIDAEISGATNETVVEDASVIIASLPPRYITETVETIVSNLEHDTILVCPAVQMTRDADGFHYEPPAAGSVTEAVDGASPEDIAVVGGFQNLAAGALSNLDRKLDVDVLLTGDDPEAKTRLVELVAELDGLRPLDAGPLAVSAEVEGLTPLLINLALTNEGMHDLGVRFV
jgi:NADPH-dependent F420 reductase